MKTKYNMWDSILKLIVIVFGYILLLLGTIHLLSGIMEYSYEYGYNYYLNSTIIQEKENNIIKSSE